MKVSLKVYTDWSPFLLLNVDSEQHVSSCPLELFTASTFLTLTNWKPFPQQVLPLAVTVNGKFDFTIPLPFSCDLCPQHNLCRRHWSVCILEEYIKQRQIGKIHEAYIATVKYFKHNTTCAKKRKKKPTETWITSKLNTQVFQDFNCAPINFRTSQPPMGPV